MSAFQLFTRRRTKIGLPALGDSSFLPNQSLCPREFIFRVQAVGAGGRGRRPRQEAEAKGPGERGGARSAASERPGLFSAFTLGLEWLCWVFGISFFQQKGLWFPFHQDN